MCPVPVVVIDEYVKNPLKVLLVQDETSSQRAGRVVEIAQ